MFIAVIIVHVIVSFALVLIVLLQAGKGTGIANVFGGAGQQVFGARTGDVLARGTTACASLFMITSLVLAMLSADRSSSVMRKQVRPIAPNPMQQAAQEQALQNVKQAVAGIADKVKKAAAQALVTPVVDTTESAPEPPIPVAGEAIFAEETAEEPVAQPSP
jgi:preprotein translocase subunit SecG